MPFLQPQGHLKYRSQGFPLVPITYIILRTGCSGRSSINLTLYLFHGKYEDILLATFSHAFISQGYPKTVYNHPILLFSLDIHREFHLNHEKSYLLKVTTKLLPFQKDCSLYMDVCDLENH